MARRRQARRLAVGILYQADVSVRDPVAVLEERRALGDRVPGFTERLVLGVAEHREDLDRVIGGHAEGWTVPRMAAVDRSILRVAAYELLYGDEVPTAVAIDEAVRAAAELSTSDSGRFVNGVLGRIARERAGTS